MFRKKFKKQKKELKSNDRINDMKRNEMMSAFELKDEGNKYFSLHKYEDAINLYSQAIVSFFIYQKLLINFF